MSIPNLPVNFKDDILAASNPKRKYQQTFNSDGSVSLEDVTVYTQQGSDFGASQVNQTNGAINNIYNERILDLDELELVTEPGFFVDAKAVKESYDELNGKTLKIATHTETYTVQGNNIRRIQLSLEDFGITNGVKVKSGYVEVRTENPSLYKGTFNPDDLVLYIANNYANAQNLHCIVYLFYTEL